MDAPLAAAARALAAGDPLDALHHVALRGDPPALALRGIALAQLGDLERARALLRARPRVPPGAGAGAGALRAGRSRRGAGDARPGLADETLESTRQALLRHGDLANAAHARLLHARRLLLLGRADDAAVAIAGWDQAPLPAAARAVHAGRRRHRAAPPAGRTRPAGAGPGGPPRANPVSARCKPRPMRCRACWRRPRLTHHGAQRLLRLDEVEALMASDALVADTARQALRSPMATVDLSRRPVLFALARQLAEAWPATRAR